MTQFDFKSIEELREFAENLNLDIKITKEFVKQIRHLHFIKGFSWTDTKDELELTTNEALSRLFLEILGYSDWDSYHKNRMKIVDLLNNKHKKSVYILKLENNKRFVGESANVKNSVNRHKKGRGTAWTKAHQFISLEKVIDDGDVKQITLEYMEKYGWENVRGYAWSQVKMKQPPKVLQKLSNKQTEKKEVFIKTEPVDIKNDKLKGKYIEGLYYKWDTDMAVQFKRKKDNKILWVPKSAINGPYLADRKNSQRIYLKFIPSEFRWIEDIKKEKKT